MKYLLLLLFIYLELFSSTTVNLDKPTYSDGEMATLTILSTEGYPSTNLLNIAGYRFSVSNSVSSVYVNGKGSTKYKLNYMFYPLKSFTIKPFTIEVNGKKKITKPIFAKVKKIKSSLRNIFYIYTKKKIYYKGDRVDVVLGISKRYYDKYIQQSYFKYGYLDYLNKKGLSFLRVIDTKSELIAGTDIIKLRTLGYLADKVGKFKITPILGEGIYLPFNAHYSNRYKKFRTYTNSLNIEIKPLESGITVHGKNLKISIKIDKKITNQNNPINAVLTIKGIADFTNISKIKLIDSKDLTIYDTQPAITKKGKISTFTKSYSILSDKDYVIKPVLFKYLDEKSGKVVTLKTESIPIKVKSVRARDNFNISKPKTKPKRESSFENRYYIYIVLILFAILFFAFIFKLKSIKFKKIRRASRIDIKNDKVMFKFLFKYIDIDPEAKDMAQLLSQNIYEKGNNEIDRVKLKGLVDRLKR